MPVVKFCPKCGHPVQPGMKFCMNCGERLPVLNAPVQENTVKPVEVKKETQIPVQQNAKPVETKKEEQPVNSVSGSSSQASFKPEETRKEEPKQVIHETVHPSVQEVHVSDTKTEEVKEEPQKPVQAVKPVEVKKEAQTTGSVDKSAVKPAEVKGGSQQLYTVHPSEPVKNASNSNPSPRVTVDVSNGQSSVQYTVNNQPQQNGNQNAQNPQINVSVPYNQPYANPAYMNQYQMQMEYKPISAWGYLGYELLYLLPVVGWIIMIVMCFAPANRNVKNFARAHVLLYIILIVIVLVIAAIAGESLEYFFRSL